jgi:hypothetical protein
MEIVRRTVPPASKALAAAGVNPVLARVFASRGVASADELDLDLSTLPGLRRCRDRGCRNAPRRRNTGREKIVIIADYDADGATACAVGVRGPRLWAPSSTSSAESLRVRLRAHAGNRRRRRAVAPRLIVTVDNASRATTASRRRPNGASRC